MDYYASTTGTGDGKTPGTPSNLKVLLSQPGAPGDVIFVRDGVHRGPFVSRLSGSPDKPIIVKAFPGENPRLTMDGPATIPPPNQRWNWPGLSVLDHVAGGHTVYIGLEGYLDYAERPKEEGPNYRYRAGIFDAHAAFVKFFGCFAWGGGVAFGTWREGCACIDCVENCTGWDGYDNPEVGPGPTGHGFYGQNSGVPVDWIRNAGCGGCGYFKHIYADAAEPWNFNVKQCVGYEKGADNARREYKPIFFCGGGNGAKNNVFSECVASTPLAQPAEGGNFILSTGSKRNPSVEVINCVSIGSKNGLRAENYDRITVKGMRMHCIQRGMRFQKCTGFTLSGNKYYGSSGDYFGADDRFMPWDQWRELHGEAGSIYDPTTPKENWVGVYPSDVILGRALVWIANYEGKTTLTIPRPTGLNAGDDFIVRPVHDFKNTILVSGKAGDTIDIPLTHLRLATPPGMNRSLQIDPSFQAFVVIPAKGEITIPPNPEPPDIEPPDVEPPVTEPPKPPVTIDGEYDVTFTGKMTLKKKTV